MVRLRIDSIRLCRSRRIYRLDLWSNSKFRRQNRNKRFTTLLNLLSEFQEISQAEKSLLEIDTAQKLLQAEIENKKHQIEEEKLQTNLIRAETEQASLLKQENLDYIVRHQYRARRYRALANAQQLPKFRNEILIQADLQRQREVNENIAAVVETLQQDFPVQKYNLNKILQLLK